MGPDEEHRCIINRRDDGALLNRQQVVTGLCTAIAHGGRLLAGRLPLATEGADAVRYRPVGYVLSHAKDNEPATMEARSRLARERHERHERLAEESARRLSGRLRRAARTS